MSKNAMLLYGATSYGATAFSPDMLWLLKGYQIPDPVVCVEVEGGEIVLFLSALEVGRAEKEAGVSRCVVTQDDTVETLAHAVIALLREYSVNTVTVSNSFPFALGAELAEQVTVQAERGSRYPARAIKTTKEVEKIEIAQRAVEEALESALGVLRASTIQGDTVVHEGTILTSETLRQRIDTELYKRDCLGINTIVAGGLEAADPHHKGSGPLRAHWPIVIDIFPRSLTNHYYSDQTRTYFKGEPSETHRRMYETVLEGQKRAIAMVRPGAIPSDIHLDTEAYFTEQGFPTQLGTTPYGFFHSLGHGVGVDIHEAPSVGAKSAQPLVEGNVITIEPGLYYDEPRDKAPAGGVRIEDILVVTKDGARNLTSMPKAPDDVVIL